MKEIVSIIIPVYNLETLISRCLESLINQTYVNLEILVINDGSTDNSEKEILKYTKNDKRVKYFYKENGGQASARNLGIKKSKGQYIMFVDGDDWIEKEMVSDMMERMSDDIDLVLSDYFIDAQSNTSIGITMPDYSKDRLKNLILSSCGPCFKIYRANIIRNNMPLFLEGIIFEDLAVIPYINSLVREYTYIKKPYYHYCIRENSTMQKTNFKSNENDVFKALENLEKLFEQNNREELEFLFIRELIYFSYVRNLFYKEKQAKEFKAKLINLIKEKYPNYYNNKYHKLEKRRIKLRSWFIIKGLDYIVEINVKIKKGVFK